MKDLHPHSPRWILLSGKETKESRQDVWPFFLEFCLRRKPLPQFDFQGLDQCKLAIYKYFCDTFTEEKDVCLRADESHLTGFVVFDPQNWTLQGEVEERTVELVIAGSLTGKPWIDARDFLILAAAYKDHKGCDHIAININREWKKGSFEKFCRRLGFEEKRGLFSL